MKQPTRYEITEKIKGIVEGKISRDSVDDWVNYYISHDDEIEMIDIEAWHYLTELGTMCVQIAPNEYLYTTDDLLNLVKEYTQSIKSRIYRTNKNSNYIRILTFNTTDC